jgi:hypothetical protein
VHALAQIVEEEEQRYESLCGDASSSHRAGYPIGRILALVQDEEDLIEKLGYTYLVDRHQTPAMHAAALRFTRAVLTVTGFQYPLTEDNLVQKLRLWALGSPDNSSGGDDDDDATATAAAAAADENDGLGGGAAAMAARSAAEAAVAAASGPTAALAEAAAVRAAAEAMRGRDLPTLVHSFAISWLPTGFHPFVHPLCR